MTRFYQLSHCLFLRRLKYQYSALLYILRGFFNLSIADSTWNCILRLSTVLKVLEDVQCMVKAEYKNCFPDGFGFLQKSKASKKYLGSLSPFYFHQFDLSTLAQNESEFEIIYDSEALLLFLPGFYWTIKPCCLFWKFIVVYVKS